MSSALKSHGDTFDTLPALKHLGDLADAWSRYLMTPVPSESAPTLADSPDMGVLSVTSVTSPESLDNSANSIRYKDDSVTDKNNENTNNINGVTGVTDKKGEYRGGRKQR